MDLWVVWFSDEAAGEEAREVAEGLRKQDPENTFKDLGSGMEGLAFVDGALVYIEQEPIGFFVLNVTGGIFELYKLYVVPEERGKGAGRAIVDWVINLAKERGMCEMCVEFTEESCLFWDGYLQGKSFTNYGDRFSISLQDVS